MPQTKLNVGRAVPTQASSRKGIEAKWTGADPLEGLQSRRGSPEWSPAALLAPSCRVRNSFWNCPGGLTPQHLHHGHAERQAQPTLPVAGLANQQLPVVHQR